MASRSCSRFIVYLEHLSLQFQKSREIRGQSSGLDFTFRPDVIKLPFGTKMKYLTEVRIDLDPYNSPELVSVYILGELEDWEQGPDGERYVILLHDDGIIEGQDHYHTLQEAYEDLGNLVKRWITVKAKYYVLDKQKHLT